MKKLVSVIVVGAALNAAASVAYATQWPPGFNKIRSDIDPALCMAVKGVVSDGANVQLQKCTNPPASNVHTHWRTIGEKLCQLGPDFVWYCIDYDGAPPDPGDSKDAKVTKWAGWKANQDWDYQNSDRKFRGHSNQCLDVNDLQIEGPGQIKVSACEDWKDNQRWRP
jgi:hypothetical protein